MASVKLINICKVYPSGVKAVSDFNLDIKDKEFIVFVGPSGCGKSTTLRMIAGLEDISSGELYIDGRLVNDVVPKDRDIAMVFQNYALYPHMSVYDNMAFGLKLRKTPKDEIDRRVKEAARILGIEQFLTRKPKALSGGQKQRVALGRAIVREPKVFLLDEPLSNLDAKLRAQMRTEITKLHNRLATTFIYVTHDQIEAMTMGTRIVVMKDGFMQQVDSPQNLYDYPVNQFVAGFIGTPQMNFFDAVLEIKGKKVVVHFNDQKIVLPETKSNKIVDLVKFADEKIPVILGVRPEDIHDEPLFISNSPDTKIKVKIDIVEKIGSETLLYCSLDLEKEDDDKIVDETAVTMIARVDPRTSVKRDDIVELAFDAKHIHIFNKETQMSMLIRDDEYTTSTVAGKVTEGAIPFGSVVLKAKGKDKGDLEEMEGKDVVLRVENQDITVGASGSSTVKAKVLSTRQVGFKQLLQLSVGEEGETRVVSAFVDNVFNAEEGAEVDIAVKHYTVLDPVTGEALFSTAQKNEESVSDAPASEEAKPAKTAAAKKTTGTGTKKKL